MLEGVEQVTKDHAAKYSRQYEHRYASCRAPPKGASQPCIDGLWLLHLASPSRYDELRTWWHDDKRGCKILRIVQEILQPGRKSNLDLYPF